MEKQFISGVERLKCNVNNWKKMLVLRDHEELKSVKKKKGWKAMSWHLIEEIQVDNKHLRKCLLLLMIRELQPHN